MTRGPAGFRSDRSRDQRSALSFRSIAGRVAVPTYVGLLRAVNVGAAHQLRMERLRQLLTQMGLGGAQTFLQSGNVVFRSPETDVPMLERRLENRIESELGLSTDLFLRSADEWSSIVRGNPFPREAEADPGHLVVTVLKSSPSAEAWNALDAAIRGPERVRRGDRHGYIVYPDGIGQSRLTAALIERSLGTRGTSRNWNTVSKLASIAAGD